MSWTLENFSDLASTIQSIVTPAAVIIGGVWAYRRYVLEENRFPHIETSAEVEFVGKQDSYWIVELRAVLTNKGKVSHRIENFTFDLNGITASDNIKASDQWGGQIDFPNLIAEGSFLPESFSYFSIGPGVTAKYSFVARVPTETTFLLFHSKFTYSDGRGFSHTMERTVATPSDDHDELVGPTAHIAR